MARHVARTNVPENTLWVLHKVDCYIHDANDIERSLWCSFKEACFSIGWPSVGDDNNTLGNL